MKLYSSADKAQLLTIRVPGSALKTGAQPLEVTAEDGTKKNYTFPIEYDQTTGRASLVLDGMMNAQLYSRLAELSDEDEAAFRQSSSTSITRFGGTLAAPAEIYATVQAFPDPNAAYDSGEMYQKSDVIDSNRANTLFGDGTSADGTECEVKAFRHLSNIRYMNKAAEFSVAARSLDWTSDSVRVYGTAAHGALTVSSGTDIGFPSIPELKTGQTLNGAGGLLNRIAAVFTGGNAVSSLRLDDTSIDARAEYLGLFQKNSGTIRGLRLLSPQVDVSSPTLKGVGAVCGYSRGSLEDDSVDGATSFRGTQTVEISCATPGASIYYTTDGTTPTSNSTAYNGAISLTSTTTIKAIAVKADMNDSAVAEATFTRRSSSGGGGISSALGYAVSADKTENGAITVSPKSASKGDTVTITVAPDKGYTLESLTVLDKDGKELALTDKGGGRYTFVMPAGKITVKAVFMDDNTMLNFFTDVHAEDYYYDAVLWAVQEGVTGGTSDTLFAPNAGCTRAQAVTFLWRAAGSPEPKTLSSFADVPADAYYAKAVAWAVENGVAKGVSETAFAPDTSCTRAQIVTFLWRAQQSPASGGENPFADVSAAAYYYNAVLWAVENDVAKGVSETAFAPNDNCTRAQIVTLIYRCRK